MKQVVIERNGVRWVDAVTSNRDELEALALEYGIPPTVVEDTLDPEHLPKYERIGEDTFFILRARDHSAPEDAGTIQELTRKVAIFHRKDLLISTHRYDLNELAEVRKRFQASDEALSVPVVMVAMIEATLSTFLQPLQKADRTLEGFEDGIFDDDIPAPTLREAHYLKRRVALARRILWQSANVLQKLVPPGERAEPLYQDMRESAEAYLFWTERLVDEVNQLLQIHLAMSSHRANEVMRVLTIFAAFFLPLTFLAGIYGMNFERMPELGFRYGYPVVISVMVLLGVGIFAWFKRRGWL